MAQNDKAVVTAAVGYIYTAPVGNPRPSPDVLNMIDAECFGAHTQQLNVYGNPTGGTFTLTVPAVTPLVGVADTQPIEVEPSADAPAPKSTKASTKEVVAVEGEVAPAAGEARMGGVTGPIAYNASPGEVQDALERVPGVGVGQVKVTGSSLSSTNGYRIAFIGSLHGKTLTLTAESSLTGGAAPRVQVSGVWGPSGWMPLGHTSREDLPEFGFDGGDVEVRGTWQNEQLREVVTEPIADYLTMVLQQFDIDSFSLYYGKDSSSTAGVFGVANGNPILVERALLVIIVDGDVKIGFYAPKASFRRDDSIALSVDEFSGLPVRATFLKYGSANKFEWINEDLFIP